MKHERGLQLSVVWFDNDVIELKAIASNGHFMGTARLYVGHDQLHSLADTIAGFPSSQQDCRGMELGTFEKGLAGGGIGLQLRTTDACGHLRADIRIRADDRVETEWGSARLVVSTEPAAVDNFVRELRGLPVEAGATASLRGT